MGWKTFLNLANAHYDAENLRQAVKQVTEKMEKDGSPELINLLIFNDEKQKAMDVVQKKLEGLSLQMRIAFATQLGKHGLSFQNHEMDVIA